ncbi:MAG TPA: hypothetical protein VFE47_16005 [Tepidisphaeraceae bacterium]|jgi:hypothetical protein|nr:hypothetical protein [Tepidisphaeraceae bacterium]
MVAFALFDFVRSSEGSLDQARIVAAELVRAALTDLEQIQGLDATLKALEKPKANRHAAALTLGLYEEWSREAEGVLERVKRLGDGVATIDGADELNRAHGRTRAMLSISLDDLIAANDDIDADRTVPIEEVRRDLRLKTKR